jgi:hypothetical protein
MKKTICANCFASYVLVKVKAGNKKGKKGKKARREWGMGNGEWGTEIGFLIPTPHSPLPTFYSEIS